MCADCFDSEISKFNSEMDFNDFQKILDQKVNKNQLKTIRDNNAKDVDFKTTYNCSSCNQEWILSFPENAWRGYFLKKNNALKRLEELELKSKKTLLVVILF